MCDDVDILPGDAPLNELFIADLLRIEAPDRETFLALCAAEIATGYRREVYEAANRLFGPVHVSGFGDDVVEEF